jgi:hypothetical protein
MTIEQCMSDCSAYNHFGVEYGGECYCGNVINTGSALATLSDCSFICPGNAYEYCGAGNRLEMYELTSLVSSSSVVQSTSSKSSSSSTLQSTSTTKSSSSSAVSSSSTSSVRQTTTSSTKSSSSSLVTSSSTTKASTTSTTTSSTAAASQTLGIKNTVGAYSFQGCYTEATNGRALSSASFYDYTAMTLEACAADCVGYTYFGVEYGGEVRILILTVPLKANLYSATAAMLSTLALFWLLYLIVPSRARVIRTSTVGPETDWRCTCLGSLQPALQAQ